MINTIVAEAIYLVKGSMNSGFFMQVVDSLTTTGPERVDILFALLLIGTTLGAGFWVGWEMVKILTEFIVKIVKLIRNGPVDRHFKRPISAECPRSEGVT